MRRWGTALALAALLGTLVSGSATAAAPPTVRVHSSLLQLAAPQQSTNWAGYNQGTIAKGVPGGFHSIGGEWDVATARPHKSGESEFSSTWIGIGGGCEDTACDNQDQTLIQTGTEQDVIYDALTGETTAEYSAWYELIPDTAIDVPLPVAAGDHMRASIVENGIGSGNWTITLENVTQAQTFTTTVDYDSDYGSAEWIVETPVVVAVYPLPPTVGFAPLPDLTTTTFDNATVNGAPAAFTPDEQMQLVDLLTGEPKATPSAPDLEGDGFRVCSYSSSCS